MDPGESVPAAPKTEGPAFGAATPARSPLDKAFKAVDALLAALLVAMLVMVLGNVILRYGFGTGIGASEELSRTMFVWITFVGAVIATREGTHLAVDSMAARLPPWGKRFCDVLSEALVLICCVLIFWGTWRQHEVNATSRSLVTGMPLIWIFGVGYVASLGIGVQVAHKLWRMLRPAPGAATKGRPD